MTLDSRATSLLVFTNPFFFLSLRNRCTLRLTQYENHSSLHGALIVYRFLVRAPPQTRHSQSIVNAAFSPIKAICLIQSNDSGKHSS